MTIEDREPPSLRVALLERVLSLARSAREGRGVSCLLYGPAGIGKTWFSKQLCHGLGASFGAVVTGHGETTPGTPALWPFIEALRALQPGAQPLRPQLMAALSPWLQTEPSPRRAAQQDAERYFLLCDELLQVLIGAARAAPLCVVFEDLHDFDHASLGLLARLLRHVHDVPLFVLGTSRVHEAGDAALEAASRGFDHACHVPGLGLGEVERWLSRELGLAVPRELCASLHERAEGNPLYVASVAKLMAANAGSGAAQQAGADLRLELPPSLRIAASRQLDTLAPACRRMLREAAVLGRDLELEVLRRSTAAGDDLEAQLEAACRTGVLQRCVPAANYRFTHALLREALLDELDPVRRKAAHLAAARALAATPGLPFDASREGRRARHFLEAGGRQGYCRAAALYVRLGHAAAVRGAHPEAGDEFALAVTALRELANAARGPAAERAQLELGRCQLQQARALWRSGEHSRSRAMCREVLELADTLEHSDLRVEAAVVAIGTDIPVSVDCSLIASCERALAAVADETAPHAILLRARLGTLLCFSAQRARGVAMIARACESFDNMTTPVDPELEFSLLMARYYALPDTASRESRKALIDRGYAIAKEPATELYVRYWEVRWHMEHGELRTTSALCADLARAADVWGDPLPRWLSRMACAAYAMRTGELSKAFECASEALGLGRALESPNAELAFVAQRVSIERLRGRGADVIELVQAGADQLTHLLEFRAALACMRAELGQWRAAQLEFMRACAQLSAQSDAECVYALCELAQTAWELSRADPKLDVFGASERAACAELHARLARFSERWVVLGQTQACGGPVLHALGVSCLALGRVADGRAHLREALARSSAAGAWAPLAHTHFQLAHCTAEVAERESALEHAQQALRLCEALELAGLAARTRGLIEASPRPARVAHGRSTPAATCEFVPVGELWRLSYAGEHCLLGDRKGMRYLERLLAAPAASVHVLSLLAEADAMAPASAFAFACGEEDGLVNGARFDAPERTLDARSALAYRRRLRELEEQRDEAIALHDLGRKQRACAELEFLQSELAGSARVRHVPTERARKAIYNCIQHAIKRIAVQHESLAKHLQLSIKTGNYCSYEPERPLDWRTSFTQ